MGGEYSIGSAGDPFQPRYGFEGFGGPPGPIGAVMQLALQGFGPGYGQHLNMTPLGFSQQNAFDTLNRMRLTQMHDDVMRNASRISQINYEQHLRGFASTIGLPWGPDQQAGARQLAGAMRSMEPTMVQMAPEWMDQLSGMRGSPTVMAEYLFRGGLMRSDPVTGARGMRQASMEQLNETLYQNMFAGDRYREMRGMTAGQAGQLFAELQSSGRMAGSVSVRDLPQEIIRDAARRNNIQMPADLANMTSEQTSAIANDSRVSSALRAGDSSRIERTLRQYTETLSAIRDIFGDNGKPNAPIPELLNALGHLSGGLSNQVDPTRLANQLRTTGNLARQSGIGLNELAQLSGSAQQAAMQMGLGSTAAPEAVRNALAFRNAYQSMGYGANRAWGVEGLDFQQEQIARLTLAATRSPAANMIGLAERLHAELGADVFEPNSDAARFMSAVRGGMGTFNRNGVDVSTNMQEPEFMRMLAESSGGRLTAGQIGSMLEQRALNREHGERSGAATYVQRTLQAQQLRQIVDQAVRVPLAGDLRAKLNQLGIETDEATQSDLIRSVHGAATGTLFGLGDAERKDASRRNAAISAAIRQQLGQSAAGQQILASAGADDFVTSLAVQGFGAADLHSRDRIGMPLLTAMSINDPKLQARAAQEQLAASIEGRLQSQMSGLGSGSMLQRLTQGIMDVDIADNKSVERVIARTLNFAPNADIKARLEAEGTKLRELKTAYDAAHAGFMSETNPERRAELQRKYEAASQAMESQMRILSDVGESAGLSRAPSLTQARVARAIRESRFLGDALSAGKDASAIAAGASAEQASARDIAAGLLDDDSLRKHGTQAVTRAERLQAITSKLGEMAEKYTGGDVGKLLSGNFQHAERGAAMADARSLRAERGELMEWAYSNVEHGDTVDDAEYGRAEKARDKLRNADRDKIDDAVRAIYGQHLSGADIVERVGGQEAYSNLQSRDGMADRLHYIGATVKEYRRIRDDKSWLGGGGAGAAARYRKQFSDIADEYFQMQDSADKQGAEDPRRRGLPDLLRAASSEKGDGMASTVEFKMDAANLTIKRDGTAELSGTGKRTSGLASKGTA